MRTSYLSLLLALVHALACSQTPNMKTQYAYSDQFQQVAEVGRSLDSNLQEVSGLVASINNPGYFWAHNDSGDQPRVFLIAPSGEIQATVFLKDVVHIDWEDIAIKRQGENSTLFIGDIGDNRAERPQLSIYAFQEPIRNMVDAKTQWHIKPQQMTVTYSNGARDAETLLYDAKSDDLIIISKRDPQVFVYPFKFQENSATTLTPSFQLPITQVTAGDINPNGDILLKNYEEIYYLKGDLNASATTTLEEANILRIRYQPERQGEAIAWGLDAQGFFVLSEWNDNEPQPLFHYRN